MLEETILDFFNKLGHFGSSNEAELGYLLTSDYHEPIPLPFRPSLTVAAGFGLQHCLSP